MHFYWESKAIKDFRISLFFKSTIALLCINFLSLQAQTQSVSVYGRVADSTTKKGLNLATIAVYQAKDTSIITYRLSDAKGEFKVPSLPEDKPLRLLITVAGYEPFRREFMLTKAKSSIDMGLVLLKPSIRQLEEVVVFSEIPPVLFRKDTIEFNAASFKTLPTALVEDLLKKLPGVEVADNGSIQVNGRPVMRILVDGKQFFGDNYKMATRNLPANLIDKVQVADDTEQFEFNRVRQDGPLNKVINLTFKKGVKRGLFGRAYVGGGTNERNELGGLLNMFRDTLQLSLVGYQNNLNRSSFTLQDLRDAGGFNRSGMGSFGSTSGVSGERININGIAFGGGTTGINKSQGVGANLNHAPSKNLSLFAQYFYNSNLNEVVSNNTTTIPLITGVNTTNTYSTLRGNEISHNLNGGVTWRIDSLSRLQFRIGFVSQLNLVTNSSIQGFKNDLIGNLSNYNGQLFSNDSINRFNYSFSYSRRIANTKKSLILFHSYNRNNNPLAQITESINTIFYPQAGSQIFEQLRRTNSPTSNSDFSVYFENVVNKYFNYSVSGRYEQSNSGKQIQTVAKTLNGVVYDSIVLPATSDVLRRLDILNGDLTFVYRKDKLRLRTSFEFLNQSINDQYSNLNNNRFTQSLSNLLLSMSLTVNKITMQYFQRVQPPSINDLIPVADNSNPFQVIKGNRTLQPVKSSYFNTSANFVNNKTGATLFIITNSSFNANPIIRRLSIDSSGLQTYTPENAGNTIYHSINLNYSRKYKAGKGFSFGFTTSIYSAYELRRVLLDKNSFTANQFIHNLAFSLNFNFNNKIELSPRYRIGLNQSRYPSGNTVLSNFDFVTNDISGTVIYRPSSSIAITTNYRYLQQSVFSPSVPASSFVTNADITYSFLQSRRAQIKLYLNDVFNTNRGVTGFASERLTSVTNTNILNRYFLLSFYYDIRDWSKRKIESGEMSNKLFRF